MKKRLFAIMLALAMVLVMASALAEEGKGAEAQTVESIKKICANCRAEVDKVNEEGLCEECALSLKEEAAKKAAEEAKSVADEAAKKAAEEEAAKKAAEEEAAKKAAEEAAKKAAEEEAAKKAAEEEAAKKATEEAAKKAAEGTTEGPLMAPGEANQAGTGTTTECNHKHTTTYHGTMVWHAPTEPTCAKEGNIGYYQCNKCEKYFKKDGSSNINEKDAIEIQLSDTVISKTTNHKLGEKVTGKPATCTETGNIEYYECSVCKGKFTDSNGTQSIDNVVIPALGHAIPADGDYTVKPTCTTAGKATYKCSKCNTELKDVEIPALGHSYGAPVWSWSCSYSAATATFRCTRCSESQTIKATVTISSEYGNCYVYTKHTAKVTGPDGKEYSDTVTTNCRRPDWYYDPCYYRNTCGHWGCGDVCTRYSDCVPCRNYRTAFRTGGYSCLATPKTGDASAIAPAILALLGAAGAMLGKKRR